MTGERSDGRGTPIRVLVVDNYDSFVYNLVQYVGEVADEVRVERNDELTVSDVQAYEPTAIVLSPGPGTPSDAGISIDLFAETTYPILGVCLGHQALCAAHGASVGPAPEVVHGKPSTITHDGKGIFAGLPDRFRVGRYHSLAVERDELPDPLVETATTTDDRETLMAVRHRERPHVGVQFHPESILTSREPDPERRDDGDDAARTGDRASTDSIGENEDSAVRTAGSDPATVRRRARREAGSLSLSIGKRLIATFCEMAVERRVEK
ncbi:anthranilate synthase component II [Halovivax limisalsi]|uniref:anthranilate synthase component II n=1 Tax=Halovivax limisalsi TaxID=1453760 RepID=UPI001FFCEE87|nr:aminodeoxychorismate/anthranilate synthase component II [Halovivax limisalsi]